MNKLESTKIALGEDPFSMIINKPQYNMNIIQTQKQEEELKSNNDASAKILQNNEINTTQVQGVSSTQNKELQKHDSSNLVSPSFLEQNDLPNQKHCQDFGYEAFKPSGQDDSEDDQPFDGEPQEQQEEQKIEEETKKIEPVKERVRKSLTQKSLKKKIYGLNEDEVECGEEYIMKIKAKCDCNISINCPTLEGDIIMTNFKIVFKYQGISQQQSQLNERLVKSTAKIPIFIEQYLNIPLTCINKIDKTIIDKKTSKTNFLEIYTKDFRYIKLVFDSADHCNDAHQRMQLMAFPETELKDVFAFKYFDPQLDLQRENIQNGWDIYQSPDIEFKRQGVSFEIGSKFKLFINQEHSYCPTYPLLHVIPSSFKDSTMQLSTKFRSKGRFPSMTFYEKGTGTSMWRSSQTMTGFITSRSQEDELKLLEIGRTNPDPSKKLIIYDARSYINALANRVNKGGFENVKDYYTNCEIRFCDIDNIHGSNSSRWLTQLDSSGWLQIMSKVLIGTNNILDSMLVQKQNVLVHCSDGWDRTAQLCSLAQIMMDPFYRTLKGFQVLIEKDWLSFGHMFHRRYGHFGKNYKDEQRCPIFTQFLDAVHQLQHQFPTQFQFNKKLLLFIITELYSCRYGTFLFNCQRERLKFELKEKTVSMWTHVNHYQDQFMNPFYDDEKQEQLPQIPLTNYFELKIIETKLPTKIINTGFIRTIEENRYQASLIRLRTSDFD
eukprot:403346164